MISEGSCDTEDWSNDADHLSLIFSVCDASTSMTRRNHVMLHLNSCPAVSSRSCLFPGCKSSGNVTLHRFPCELPYFEGDFWPNVLEESIKELEKEVEQWKKNTATSETTEGIQADRKNAKKSSASRANKKKPGMPNVANDLFQRLYATMEKHKKLFFVIPLHAGPDINTLPPIMDPDPLLTCDLMDGRWEFSSLLMLVETDVCTLGM
ncbi:CREB-binding protein-like [Onychostoma macrolepis]|uniref:histone acetyltransferase n=1 Tax=Onychostoma macrolepis TaxID=369639 RepID=A0A7J6DCK4_9TELE|nr:CREB-binding protein-like [Onychostoma macrolepis]KAF4117002.1 hypothetical protein G5714_001555 [Onychostoma macrolepis]